MDTGRNQLAANTIDGVYVCENPSDSSRILFDRDFYEEIFRCRDGVTIYGNVSDEWADKIANEYGIL